jgi:4-amino-4-deoxy-L-arabinose transferase-like glycosyltransferase
MELDTKTGTGSIMGTRKCAMPPKLDLKREDRSNLIILFFFGLVLRLYALIQIYMIANDGAFQYIPVAKLFYQGEYLQALAQPQLPLYPFLISLLAHVTGDIELAGQLISIIFSLLTIFPLYLIGKSLFGPRPAFWTVILYLINPLMLRSSVDVLQEGVVIFFFFSSVYCSLRFLQEGKGQWLVWTIVFAVGGGLARMSTPLVVVILGAWLGYGVLRAGARERELAYHYLWVVVAIIGLTLISFIPGLLGWKFFVTKKFYKLIGVLLNQWFVYGWPSLSRLGENALFIVTRFIEKAYPPPFLLALFGLGWRVKAKEFGPDERYLALVIGVFIVILFPLLRASERYHLPAIFLLYFWAGFGFVKIRELIDRSFTRYRRFTAVISVMILLGSMLPISLQPQRLDKVGLKEAGLWLRGHAVISPLILADDPRVAYYAGGAYLLIPPEATADETVEKGIKEKADYLVVQGQGTGVSGAFAPFTKKGELELVLRHTYGKKGGTIYIYKIMKEPRHPRKAS